MRSGPVAAVLALGLAGCGGDSESGGAGGLEKTKLAVGTLPVPDAAPLFIAQKRGYFGAEGLQVKIEIVQSGPAATPQLVAGTLDFSLLNYVSAFAAQASGAVKLKIAAEAYNGAPNGFLVLVPKDSEIREPKDLKGKKIAVSSLRSVLTLAIEVSLQPYNIVPKDIKFVPMPFPEMERALKTKQVDAVWCPDPFIISMQSSLGARTILDTMQGPLDQFPIAGWGTSEKFGKNNPRTVAAFQRAIARAQREASQSRPAVSEILPTYTRIDRNRASLITLGTYPTSMNRIRLQRVSDFMLAQGYLKQKFDVGTMLIPPAQ